MPDSQLFFVLNHPFIWLLLQVSREIFTPKYIDIYEHPWKIEPEQPGNKSVPFCFSLITKLFECEWTLSWEVALCVCVTVYGSTISFRNPRVQLVITFSLLKDSIEGMTCTPCVSGSCVRDTCFCKTSYCVWSGRTQRHSVAFIELQC